MYNGENTSKNVIIIRDVIWLMYIRFLVHMQKEKSKMNIAGVGTA